MTCRVRSSHPDMFYKNSVIKNFNKITDKYLFSGLFNKNPLSTTLSKRYSSTVFLSEFS